MRQRAKLAVVPGHPDESGRMGRDPRYFTVSFFEPAGLPSSINSTS